MKAYVQTVTSKILGKDFKFDTKHIGLFLDDNLWSHDKWVVTIEGQTFDYNTGIGHRQPETKFSYLKDRFTAIMSKNPKQTKESLTLYNEELAKVSKVKPLQIDDVLYNLIIDADAGRMDFEDFCDTFGYSEDSIKANDIHRACQKIAKKIKKFIPDLEEARELFSDY